ncbi:D-xylose transport system substrate-binding protein [Kineosporia succinea]|uniref:D-xylose transport system substrate-binding protein n=2 Tax=Kineosporia succinea TaxID=84632 RepID=A0ABT9P9G0_9ACTN|nr:substrate-binding domain-containing protein [Kineosporia succinea]MDP9829049.1 D-xylose transport system substrate-binding protein [Kineosporia succinea]
MVALTLGTAAVLTLSACGGSSSDDPSTDGGSDAKVGKVGVILPDTASSTRWEQQDRPELTAAFQAAGVESDIQNAQGDKNKFQSIADGMINEGVSVLLITDLDAGSGTAVIKKATAAGIPVIDYDRLTLGGGAKYYVSFDNVAVGTAIGEGLVKCLKDDGVTSGGVIELDGSPTDNNATLFKEGYDKAIKDAGYTVAAEQAVADWDNTVAATNFTQLDTKTKGEYVGVAAANDGLGGAVISRLKANGTAGKIPVTGQDASIEGLQRLLQGTQCVSVFKAVKKEAAAAAELAIALAKGDTAAADAVATGTVQDTELNTPVKSVLLTPEPIFQDNVQDVIDGGGTTADKICTTEELKKLCTEHNVG